MLRNGTNIVKPIKTSRMFKEKNIVSPVFYNAGGTAFSVNNIPVAAGTPFIGFVNDQMILKNDEFDIKFTDPKNPDNKIIVAYQQYDPLNRVQVSPTNGVACS